MTIDALLAKHFDIQQNGWNPEEENDQTPPASTVAPTLLGDVNLDGLVNFLDIPPFITLAAG